MSEDELLAELRRLEDCLRDIAEERAFYLGQTNLHIGNRKIAEMREEWECDEEAVRCRIIATEVLLDGE